MNLASSAINLGLLWLAAVIAGGGLALTEGIRAWRARRNRQHTGRRP